MFLWLGMKRDLNFQFYDPVLLGLQDEIFQGDQPVLAGVDASSIYCYLLAEAEHHDEDTWGIHLLDAKAQGLDPDCIGRQLLIGDWLLYGDEYSRIKLDKAWAKIHGDYHGKYLPIKRQAENFI